MAEGVAVVCAWRVACAIGFLKKLPREYLQGIAEADGTVTLFSCHRFDVGAAAGPPAAPD